MSEYQVGDEVTPPQTRELPTGTILLDDKSDDYAIAVRIANGEYRWMIRDEIESGEMDSSMPIFCGNWRIIHLPRPNTPKVGDVIDTEAAAKLLPVGSVMLEVDNEELVHEGERPAVKVRDNLWMYWMIGSPMTCDDELPVDQPHRVVHIPDSADAGTGRTAA